MLSPQTWSSYSARTNPTRVSLDNESTNNNKDKNNTNKKPRQQQLHRVCGLQGDNCVANARGLTSAGHGYSPALLDGDLGVHVVGPNHDKLGNVHASKRLCTGCD